MTIALPADTPLQLSAGTQIVLRDDRTVQFGLDATRAGIIQVPRAAKVAHALLRLRAPTEHQDAVTALAAAGMHPAQAAILVDDLVAYRVLRPATTPVVGLIGQSPLAEMTEQILTSAGVRIRRPLRKEVHVDFIRDSRGKYPLVLADQGPRTNRLAKCLAQHPTTWVAGSVVDARGVIGPVQINGQGSCLGCLDLHRVEVDPDWMHVMSQHDNPAGQVAVPTTVAATAAWLAMLAAQLAGLPDPPGVEAVAPEPGHIIEVDPYRGNRRYRLPQHSRCPFCFYRN